jgi:hypothetical protein
MKCSKTFKKKVVERDSVKNQFAGLRSSSRNVGEIEISVLSY